MNLDLKGCYGVARNWALPVSEPLGHCGAVAQKGGSSGSTTRVITPGKSGPAVPAWASLVSRLRQTKRSTGMVWWT